MWDCKHQTFKHVAKKLFISGCWMIFIFVAEQAHVFQFRSEQSIYMIQ